jgi:hypothetical protein
VSGTLKLYSTLESGPHIAITILAGRLGANLGVDET